MWHKPIIHWIPGTTHRELKCDKCNFFYSTTHLNNCCTFPPLERWQFEVLAHFPWRRVWCLRGSAVHASDTEDWITILLWIRKKELPSQMPHLDPTVKYWHCDCPFSSLSNRPCYLLPCKGFPSYLYTMSSYIITSAAAIRLFIIPCSSEAGDNFVASKTCWACELQWLSQGPWTRCTSHNLILGTLTPCDDYEIPICCLG